MPKKCFSSVLLWNRPGWYVPAYQLNGDKHWHYAGGLSYDPAAREFISPASYYEDISEVWLLVDTGWKTLEYRPANLQCEE